MPANSIDHRKTCDLSGAPSVQPLPPGVHTSAAVIVRGSQAHVAAIAPHHDCYELRFIVDPDRRRLVLLWPFDRPRAIRREARIRVVRPRCWIRHVRRALGTQLEALTPRTASGDVDVVPYQLAPALAAAAGADRILLSDEVGLGKTIQAGWIIADLVARDPAARILLAVPASVRRQWISELSRRFELEAADVDARWLRGAIADLPADVNPWTAPGIYVVSLDFMKRTDVWRSMLPHTWDALVVDEAHTAAAPTDRYTALAGLAATSRRVILITATPYSGNPAGFASMTSLGALGGSPPLMFRRCREDVGDPRLRRHRFASVRLTRTEVTLQRLLERYSRLVWNGAADSDADARLAVTILRKRALSSAAAVARSLERRRDLLSARAPVPRQLALFDDGDDVDDDAPSAILGAPGLADAALEQRWLEALIAAARAASARDSKLHYLQRFLRRLAGESAVVFTEYRDTLIYLARALPPSLQLHGGLTSRERASVQARFNRDGGLLLATDAAAEGLNLHGRARVVINYELPWNPARLEQRIGRVDRIGQSRTVHAITLTARDTAEDLVIVNIARRLARVVATLGSGDRLGAFLDEARVARAVIGDMALVTQPDDEAVPIVRAQPQAALETGTAALLWHRRGGGGPLAAADLHVTAVRARACLPPGYVIVRALAARTVDGDAIAWICTALHVAAHPGKPVNRARARADAERVLRDLPDADSGATDAWLAKVRADHESAIDRRLARERALRDQVSASAAVQPGLFDRRALDAAARREQATDDLITERTRRIALLERSRPLRLTTEPIAVLIAWR